MLTVAAITHVTDAARLARLALESAPVARSCMHVRTRWQSQNETVAPTDEIGAVVRSHLGGEVCAVVIAKQLDAARCFGLVGIHHRVRVAGSGALSAVRLLEVLEELYSAEKPLPRVGRSRRRIHDAY